MSGQIVILEEGPGHSIGRHHLVTDATNPHPAVTCLSFPSCHAHKPSLSVCEVPVLAARPCLRGPMDCVLVADYVSGERLNEVLTDAFPGPPNCQLMERVLSRSLNLNISLNPRRRSPEKKMNTDADPTREEPPLLLMSSPSDRRPQPRLLPAVYISGPPSLFCPPRLPPPTTHNPHPHQHSAFSSKNVSYNAVQSLLQHLGSWSG